MSGVTPSELQGFFDETERLAAELRELNEKFAAIRERAKKKEMDFARLRALAIAHDADKHDEKKKDRVAKLIRNGTYAGWYAEILKIGQDEQNAHRRSSSPNESCGGVEMQTRGLTASGGPGHQTLQVDAVLKGGDSPLKFAQAGVAPSPQDLPPKNEKRSADAELQHSVPIAAAIGETIAAPATTDSQSASVPAPEPALTSPQPPTAPAQARPFPDDGLDIRKQPWNRHPWMHA